MMTGTKSETEEKERCVNVGCGRETPYTKDTPIEQRLCYVEGAGQLCGLCWNEIYDEEEE